MAAPRKILICEDEDAIREFEVINLQRSGYEVVDVSCGEDAIRVFDEQGDSFSVAILDIMMPGIDGFAVCKHIREKNNTLGIIMLSAKSQEMDKVNGLMLGADDYITKPFNPVEVLARVRSQLRRYLQLGGGTVRPTSFVIGGIELDDNAKAVTVDGEPVSLTPKEYDILRFLMQNAGTVFTPAEIYRRVWDDIPLNAAGAIAVHIRHLREKLEINPAEPRYIKVVWGKGYKMEVNPI